MVIHGDSKKGAVAKNKVRPERTNKNLQKHAVLSGSFLKGAFIYGTLALLVVLIRYPTFVTPNGLLSLHISLLKHKQNTRPITSHEFRQHPPCHRKFCMNTTCHVLDNWHVAYIHHPQGSWWQAHPTHNCKDPHSTKPRHTIPGPFQVSVPPGPGASRCQVS